MKTLLYTLKPYRAQCAFIILVALADVGGSLLVPTITANMINSAIAGGAIGQLVHQGIIMLVIALSSGMLTLFGSWLCARLSANLGRDLREAVYDKSLSFSASDFEIFGTASMITRTLNDINIIQQAFVAFIQMILPVPIICIMGIVLSFRIHTGMGLLLLTGTGFVLLAALFIMRKASPIFDKLQRFLDQMNVVLRENLTGVRVIRAFNKESRETERMEKTFEKYAASSIQANYLFAGLDCLATVVINLMIVAVLYYGGNAVGSGNMEIGDITAVSEYAIWILLYIMMAQMTVLMLPRALTCIRRVSAVLNHKPEITDGTDHLQDSGQDEIVAFDDVSFCFSDADEETLSHISFTCRRGKTTAVVGGTGSGKSTITKLLLRYHDVSDGKIMLHGQDIRSLSQKDVRDAVSYVPQKAWLFSGTIAENLRYGNSDATEEELRRALNIAQSDFVFRLPQGYDSPVAQGGMNFSGGQKQRLSIARALVKKADLYVFDDSFSALDFKTDAALRHALAEEIKDSAVLIITQRISTILHADQIIVLNDGKIAGKGRHEELMSSCPVYVDIVNSQMKGGKLDG